MDGKNIEWAKVSEVSRALGDSLRRRAERLSAEGGEVRRLLQDMCLHQAELEVENDELREAQQSLETSRRQYMQLFEMVPAACFAIDPAGRLGAVNRRAEALFGIGRRGLRGRPILALAAPEAVGRLHAFIQAIWERRAVAPEEFAFCRFDGSRFDGLLDGTPMRDPASSCDAILCGIVDVSARNQAVAELRLAKAEIEHANAQLQRALAAKTNFLAAASHDLRQPVQALALFVDVLGHQPLGLGNDAVLTRIREAVGALGALLNSLLDISKLEAGLIVPKFERVEALPLLDRLAADFAALAAAKGLRFRARLAGAGLRTDPTLLERILRNMLSNAVRYTEAGGILFAARRRSGMLRVEVWDTGVGVPQDHLDLIFEDFHQVGNAARNREEGLGLGLAIVARLSRLLGCRISVRSRVGRGSCFSLEVPLAA